MSAPTIVNVTSRIPVAVVRACADGTAGASSTATTYTPAASTPARAPSISSVTSATRQTGM
jgi:hypothetical protein